MPGARKETQPYRASIPQPWASEIIETSHNEALFGYGEMGLFTLMWRAIDHERGLVAHCTTCFGDGSTSPSPSARQAEAFQQPLLRECPDCFGTTFEGGYRAQIVRPMLMADRDSEVDETEHGVVVVDTINFETTSDFTFHRGDYLFRSDNTRFQCEEKNEAVVRTGFAPPNTGDSYSGVSTAHLEAPTAVVFRIPPTDTGTLQTRLGLYGSFTMGSLVLDDEIRPEGYL